MDTANLRRSSYGNHYILKLLFCSRSGGVLNGTRCFCGSEDRWLALSREDRVRSTESTFLFFASAQPVLDAYRRSELLSDKDLLSHWT